MKRDESGEIEVAAEKLAALFGGPQEPSPAELVGLDDFDDSLIETGDLTLDERKDLEMRFHAAMIALFQTAKRDTGYHAGRFIAMVAESGGAETARRLLRATQASDGFVSLVEMGRPDLTVEALALDPTFQPLFSEDDLLRAQERLRLYQR